MSTFFFNTENAINSSWADVAEGLNSYYAGPNPGLTPLDRSGITDQEQQISSYVKIDRKIGLFFSPDGKMVISMASPVEGQTLGIKEIDFTSVKYILDAGVKVVYLGYLFKEESVPQNKVIEDTCFFGRRVIDNRLTNFDTDEDIEGNVSAALWMAFYKIKDCDIYYVVLNDNLIESSVMRSSQSQPDLRGETEVFEFINSHDGSLKDAVFAPDVDPDSKFFGSNIIIATGDTVEIDVFGYSQLHKIAGRRLKDSELPDADIEIECSSTYTKTKNRILVDLDKPITTISYRWVTGTELDYLASKSEQLRYDFVILKQ